MNMWSVFRFGKMALCLYKYLYRLLSFAQEKKNLKIFAFEPLPSTYKKMQAKFCLNPDLAGKVQLYNKGLSKKHADIIKYIL